MNLTPFLRWSKKPATPYTTVAARLERASSGPIFSQAWTPTEPARTEARPNALKFTRMLLTSKFYPDNIFGMDQVIPATYSSFLDGRRLTSGPLHEVAVAILRAQAHADGHPLVFNDDTGQSIDLDLRGGEDAVLARYTVIAPPQAPKGRGRPKLGVVAREVTLLPEHWDWLTAQPGGASVALRKLVHEARRKGGAKDRARQACDRAYHVMSTLAGDLPGFEEASRALFAGDHERLLAHMTAWPQDVRAYVLQLAAPAPG